MLKMADAPDPRKAHHVAHSGRKAEKKKSKKPQDGATDPRKRNPKAFAIQSVNKAERRFRRTMDIKAKTMHIPHVSRIPLKPPPAVVALVGPPKVGKTTLMRCMIKNFTKQNMSTINGPVTLVSGKKKRLTLIECSNDINNMIDVAKIADLVLLLIDAKSGFEMETFEFLNICQVHGMPRVMGVLTHLDLFKNKKALQRTKVQIKKRYRTEIPRGEKMFYLSGILHSDYLKNEVRNLGRFISIMKFEPSSWKKTHPYILADRMEDITNPQSFASDPNCDRTVCLYGYARGGPLKKNSSFHVPGCGDYLIKSVHFLPDPCPLPEKKKRRSLNEKERLIYAPMSGVGGIVYDKDAVYIDLKGSHHHLQDEEESEKPEGKIKTSLISTQHPIDAKMSTTKLALFAGAEPLEDDDASSESESEEEAVGNCSQNSFADDDFDNDVSDEDDEMEDTALGGWSVEDEQEGSDDYDSDSDDDVNGHNYEENNMEPPKKKQKVHFADAPVKNQVAFSSKTVQSGKGLAENNDALGKGDDSAEESGHVKWKKQLVQKAADAFYKRQQEVINLQKLVYGNRKFDQPTAADSESENEELGGLFHVARQEKEKEETRNLNGFDCSRFAILVSRDWADEENTEAIMNCFLPRSWRQNKDAEHDDDSDDELYGDFEEYGSENGTKAKDYKSSESEEEDKGEENGSSKTTEEKEKTHHEKRMEKKRKLKELFNSQYCGGQSYLDDLKNEVDEQTELNIKEFEDMNDEVRVQYEGFRPGLYLRMEIDQMPCEFVKNFDPSHPVVVGSLLKGEDKMGYVQVRIKKHRWYPKILKSQDPLIISLGWRRFQTIPVYFMKDHNFRCRYLKYTPKHLHCSASFWGPLTAQKSGFLAVQTVSEITSDFRIAALGSVLELDQTTEISKKLKLIGNPRQIFRKTAFIEGMFQSVLEVAKYEGALIKTVSGIRGQVKKALRIPPGVFRATFEDKILMSDIVFLRTWVKVEVPQFCTTICSLLLPPDRKSKWEGMKPVGRLRYEQGLKAPVKTDSHYIPIERKLKEFAPLVVPKNIQKDLPFKDKIIHKAKKMSDGRVAVVREPREREVAKFIEMMKTVHNLKVKKQTQAMRIRARAHRKQKNKDKQQHHKKLQEKKKRIFQKTKPNKKM